MSETIKYEMMILLTEEFNDNELKIWAFNYAKTLRRLNASEISVISRGKRDLSYEIASQKRGNGTLEHVQKVKSRLRYHQ